MLNSSMSSLGEHGRPHSHPALLPGRWWCLSLILLLAGVTATMAQVISRAPATAVAYCRQWQGVSGLSPSSSSAGPLLATTTWLALLFWAPHLQILLPGQLFEQHTHQWNLQPVQSLASGVVNCIQTAIANSLSLGPTGLLQTSSVSVASTIQHITAFLSTVHIAVLSVAATWLLVELAFYLFWFRPKYRLWNALCNAHQSPAAQGTAECYALWKRFIAFSRAQPCQVDFLQGYLSTWFRGAAPESIKRGNMEELFAYGFFYRTREQMEALGLGHIPSEMASDFEDCFSVKFPPGYNPGLEFMSHLWDNLRASWRPLAFYAATEALAMFVAVVMWAMGFKKRQLGDLHYYTRGIPDVSSSVNGLQQQQPVVFIHGVAGLLPYLPLLARFAALQAPLLVLDMKHVGLRLSATIPTVDSLATAVAAALQQHNLPPALVVAHSYGTLIAGRLLRLQRSVVRSVLFVDPVCFGMFHPRLLHGFIYATLKLPLSRPLHSAFNLLLWLVSKDIHLAATFARKFYWSDLNLWPEDLPGGSCVVLSGGDALVAAEDMYKMLLNSGRIKVLYKPNLIHGGFIFDLATSSEVLTSVKTLASAVLDATGVTDTAAAAAVASGNAADVAAEVMDAQPVAHQETSADQLRDLRSRDLISSRSPDVCQVSPVNAKVDVLSHMFGKLQLAPDVCCRDNSSRSSAICINANGCATCQHDQQQPKVARRCWSQHETLDVAAAAAAPSHGSSANSRSLESDTVDVQAAAAAAATMAAAAATAQCALLAAATGPAGLLSSYQQQRSGCHAGWDEHAEWQQQAVAATAVQRRYTAL